MKVVVALFWLSDEAWAAIKPHLPRNQPGARRVDDRRVISRICDVLKSGGAVVRLPGRLRASTTVYNRFNRWTAQGFRLKLLDALVDAGAVTRSTAIDSTYVKTQRAAFGGKKGAKAQALGRSRGGWTTKIHALTNVVGRPFALMLTPDNVADVTVAPEQLARMGRALYELADKGYDADPLCRSLRQAGVVPVIPGGSNRKRTICYDRKRDKARRLVEKASAVSGTSVASQRATTSSQPTFCQAWQSPLRSRSGSE